ncbi:hypothetical protein [Candidatus Nanohalococcus occultus]|uniref:Uncharacterized protein n=1 Tax=Candidatus Nanohalococcus occultus TaxID=2978047 RepID=A0ABY8CFP9_9ARCH|nr:hypothetical protein SVXNc_1040 [Candidatus Nanohaloarchaeota archaeon SVXNc]
MGQEFGAVIAVGLAVFGLVFVASEAVNLDQQQRTTEDIVFLERNYGELGNAKPASRTSAFGSFSVGEGRGDILVERRDDETVSAELLSSQSLEFDYNGTQPRGGTVSFEVLGKEGYGALYVEANGQRVFSNPLVTEATPEIRIPEGVLKNGDNTIKIGTTKGGFFSSTEYRIEDLQVRVNDRKFNDHVDTFQMYGYELQDYVNGQISFNIANSVITEPLEVYVNDNKLYEFSSVRSTQTVNITPQNAELRNGINTVKFKTDGEASYDIENAALTVQYLGSTQEVNINEVFELTQSELNYAERNNTVEQISFDYTGLLGSPRSMSLELNDRQYNITPSNGENRIEVNSELNDMNSLEIRSDGSFELENFRVNSEMVE